MQGAADTAADPLSIVHGVPLAEAPGVEAQTIVEFARQVSARWPEREAVVAHAAAGVVRWRYADLWQQSLQVARALAANGVGKDARVGILMSNRPEYVAAVFGIAMAGGVVVALHTFATPAELDYLLKASGVEFLLFERRVAKKDFLAMLGELEPALAAATGTELVSQRYPFLRHLAVLESGDAPQWTCLSDWQDFLRAGDAIPESLIEQRMATLSPADTAILFFSSGSTGQPKGVLHNQRAVALQWQTWPVAMGFTGELRAWTANGFFWSGNFAMVIGSALSSGGALVLQPVFDPAEALHLMQAERVNAPFAMLHQWGRIAEEPDFRQTDLSSLHFFDAEFNGVQHPNIPNLYHQRQAFGCTETLTICTATDCGEDGEKRREGHGQPLPGNILKIVDPLSGEVLPRGERGEIAVKGPTLMMGYLGKTAEECFDEEGFYRTGDGGYLDDSGCLFWEGRLTDIIKTGGANVSPLEVDDVINAFPGVRATQTVGLPHATLGEIVVSCIVPLAGDSIDVPALREFLKQRLASYKLPREILLLGEEELSLTGSGNKIKSAEVKKLAAARLGLGQDAAGG